jgi:hypothetical protein
LVALRTAVSAGTALLFSGEPSVALGLWPYSGFLASGWLGSALVTPRRTRPIGLGLLAAPLVSLLLVLVVVSLVDPM